MTRKRVIIEYISNDSARKATFKKRKKGLMKKVREITILCGIAACAVVFSPYDPQPEVWPDPSGAQQVISRFQNSQGLDQTKNVNQESYLTQRITKANEQLKKHRKEIREKEMTQVMVNCINGKELDIMSMSMEDLNDMEQLIDENLMDIGRKINALP